jgi:hypothetical protein
LMIHFNIILSRLHRQNPTVSLYITLRLVLLCKQLCCLWGTKWIFMHNVSYFYYYYYLFLTAIGLTPGGSSTVHIYTQTVHRIQRTEHT